MLKALGAACKEFREFDLELTQAQVAEQIGCSKENVSAFECGRNNNARILLWYIEQGFGIEQEVQNGDFKD